MAAETEETATLLCFSGVSCVSASLRWLSEARIPREVDRSTDIPYSGDDRVFGIQNTMAVVYLNRGPLTRTRD